MFAAHAEASARGLAPTEVVFTPLNVPYFFSGTLSTETHFRFHLQRSASSTAEPFRLAAAVRLVPSYPPFGGRLNSGVSPRGETSARYR